MSRTTLLFSDSNWFCEVCEHFFPDNLHRLFQWRCDKFYILKIWNKHARRVTGLESNESHECWYTSLQSNVVQVDTCAACSPILKLNRRASYVNQFPRSHNAETALSNRLRAALSTKILADWTLLLITFIGLLLLSNICQFPQAIAIGSVWNSIVCRISVAVVASNVIWKLRKFA